MDDTRTEKRASDQKAEDCTPGKQEAATPSIQAGEKKKPACFTGGVVKGWPQIWRLRKGRKKRRSRNTARRFGKKAMIVSTVERGR